MSRAILTTTITHAVRDGELEHVVVVAGEPVQSHSSRAAAMCALMLALALTGCVSIRAPQLRNVSVEADVSSQISGDFSYRADSVDYRGGHVGRIAVQLDQPLTPTLTYRLGIEHRSLLDTGRDRGEERAIAGIVWRPFGGAR